MTCRFAFHHLENPAIAFAEMFRLAAPGGRIVLCEVTASDQPAKAAALNAMDRIRDPSTAEHRPLIYLRRLFEATGLGDPQIQRFDVSYLAPDFVARSFPLNDDRAGLLAMIEASADGHNGHRGALDAGRGQVLFPLGGAKRGEARLNVEIATSNAAVAVRARASATVSATPSAQVQDDALLGLSEDFTAFFLIYLQRDE